MNPPDGDRRYGPVHPVAEVYIALINAIDRDDLTYDEWVAKITRRFKRAFSDA